MRLENKVAIVTGAGLENGFGRAIALALAAEGANVTVCDLCKKYDVLPQIKIGTMEDLNKRVAEIKALGRDALAVACDVRSKASVNAMVKATVEKFGKVNILVNNAGFIYLQPLSEITEEIWYLHIDVLSKGSLLCSQAVVPEMQKTGERGKIVSIASIAGVAGWQFVTSYCMAKFAQVGMTLALAPEFAAQNINFNAVCPGLITSTAIGYECADGFARCAGITVEDVIGLFLANMPQGQQGTPEDIAKAVTFLCSPESDHVNGVALQVSGGQRL